MKGLRTDLTTKLLEVTRRKYPGHREDAKILTAEMAESGEEKRYPRHRFATKAGNRKTEDRQAGSVSARVSHEGKINHKFTLICTNKGLAIERKRAQDTRTQARSDKGEWAREGNVELRRLGGFGLQRAVGDFG